MNTKSITRRAAIAAVSGVIALTSYAAAAAADTTRLRMHTFYGTEIDPIIKAFRDRVRDESDGSLRINVFHGGELVASDQLLSAVQSGSIDIAHGHGGYWSGQVDIGNIEAGLPGGWTSLEEANAFFASEPVASILNEAYSEAGVVFLGKGYGHDYDLLTKEPIASLEDLKSLRIRATSNVAKVLESLEIPTVFLPAGELYIGMSTGVIDGAIYGGPIEYEQLKLNETAQYYTRLNMLMPGWTETFLANEDKWASLSDEHKAILETALAQFAQDITDWLAEGNQSVVDKGDVFEFFVLPESDSKQLTVAAQQVWQEEAARSERNAKLIELLIENAKAQGRL
ncbi:ABC transporter substrate-binding protein [Roseobacter denitrificans]|uniref:Periplasmic solute-binding protein, putative n=1 Tax=Roseobacter denitrificans (strain ATCC 33942 / OCh 114) TaxID=375451 RepID=Q16BX4_ROSDO|nr:TRAP transporter substrate-binding protein [Roseobacter denitrificans]ABG30519.1 periplasmic solute-binding protein, putative [Roseobacter denitrificans OCh 114]AVL53671.1 ABC transporter substrate-binding protein [Roseobacter denitrificans]SFF73718.1 TRAP-type mannitol/chloroaromatic compound transport system, substrate-binding protein [Roseobacter denitrificans OCh 114]